MYALCAHHMNTDFVLLGVFATCVILNHVQLGAYLHIALFTPDRQKGIRSCC